MSDFVVVDFSKKAKAGTTNLANATDLACAFEILRVEENQKMKVMTLLYLAQEFTLKHYKRPLFNEEVEAWQKGPVVPSVHTDWKTKVLANEDEHLLTDPLVLDIVHIVDRICISETDASLSERTHRQGSPWQKTYYDPANQKKVIDRDLIATSDINNDLFLLFEKQLKVKEDLKKELDETAKFFPDWQ